VAKIHVACCALILFFDASQAQQITGNLEGRILNAQGQPLTAANITVTSPDLQGTRGSASDMSGYFRVLALPVGLYKVRISLLGYQPITYDDISIRLGKTTFIGEIRLQSQAIEMPAITVSGAKPLVDPASTTTGANLAAETYEVLPVERNYRNIVTLLPHTVESFRGDGVNLAGATGLENKYFIDGIDVTDSYQGISGTNLPYNFIKQIEVKTGGYEAEYRSALGGVVNAITYSGGNEFHGQAFGFFANNRFAGDPKLGALEPSKGGFSQYDVGLSLGGPLIHDKLWFFTAYNPNFEREDVIVRGIGFFPDHKTTHIFAGKITWRASENNTLLLNIFGDPGQHRAVGEPFDFFGTPASFLNPDPYLSEVRSGSINISLNGNHILSNKFLLETSLSRLTQKKKDVPATERGRQEIFLADYETGTWSGGYVGRLDQLSVQSYLSLKGTLIWGKHLFKTGLEYKENRLDIDVREDLLFRFGPTSYLYIPFVQIGTVANRVPSVFVQDSWGLNERLRINAGLRWDGQFLVASNGKVAQKILAQYQPRLGLIYQIGEIGSQKIFGSFGRFYQELLTTLSTNNHLEGGVSGVINYDHDPRTNPAGGDSSFYFIPSIKPEVKDLEGQYYDEFTLGYERLIGKNLKFGLRGIYRPLRQAIQTGFVPATNDQFYGNFGRGNLSIFPKARRDYTALELILEKTGGRRLNFLATYVLSRNYGNYTGFFDSNINRGVPNSLFYAIEGFNNATGLLPNDRTHVLKFSGAYRSDWGLTLGTSFSWQSGTPLNEFGGLVYASPTFLRQRGTAGRTPSVWDLNLRLAYDLNRLRLSTWKPRLILDIFHVASQRQPALFDEFHYFNVDENGNQINPNPLYGQSTRFQPPMAVRLGLEVGF